MRQADMDFVTSVVGPERVSVNQADLEAHSRDESFHEEHRHGLFFPPAPGSSDVATIGGMVANNSGGMHALKYGVTRDYVLKLEVVLPTGEIVHLGCNAFKSASGYDLTRLFVGSEGTLGVATEVTLRLLAFLVLPKESKSGILTQQPNRNGIAEPLCANLGPAPSAEDIVEIRREMWAGFPREDI